MSFIPIDLLRLFLVLNVNTCCQCNKHSVVLDYIVSQSQQYLMSIFAKLREQPEVYAAFIRQPDFFQTLLKSRPIGRMPNITTQKRL